MMDNRYREELDRIRLTDESKGALAAALAARRSAPERRSRRVPLRRLAALAACVCLVLGLMNYPAIAAGAERVFRYILGVGAAETSASLLVQGEGISHGDGDFLYLIDGAYQRDGVLTVPLDVVSREESPDREAAMRYRITVYDAEGERLPQVYRWDGELREFRGAETVRFQPLDAYSNWLAWTWLPQGYAGAASNCFLMGTEGSAGGPYTFDVDLYITGRGWQRTVWRGGTLELDTPQAVEATEASRTFAEGTVTALVGADGRSVSFYGELTPQLAARGEELIQLVIPAVWFVDEAGNRWESDLLDWPVSEEYWPEFRLAEQTEGEIVAIEVNEVYFNIVRTDQPQDSPQRQYMPDYNDLGWVIDLT